MVQKSLNNRGFSRVRQSDILRRQESIKKRDLLTSVRLDSRKKGMLQTETRSPFEQLKSKLISKGYTQTTEGDNIVLNAPDTKYPTYYGDKKYKLEDGSVRTFDNYKPVSYVFDKRGNILKKIERGFYVYKERDYSDGAQRFYKPYDKTVTTYKNNKPVKTVTKADVTTDYVEGSKGFRATRGLYTKEIIDYKDGTRQSFRPPKFRMRGDTAEKRRLEERARTELEQKYKDFFDGKAVSLTRAQREALATAIGTASYANFISRIRGDELFKKKFDAQLKDAIQEYVTATELEKLKNKIRNEKLNDLYLKTGGWTPGSKEAAEFSKLPLSERKSIIQKAQLREISDPYGVKQEYIKTQVEKTKNLPLKDKIKRYISTVPANSLSAVSDAINGLKNIWTSSPPFIKTLATGAIQNISDVKTLSSLNAKQGLAVIKSIPQYYKIYKITKDKKVTAKELSTVKSAVNKIKEFRKDLNFKQKTYFNNKEQKFLRDISKQISAGFFNFPKSYLKGAKDGLLSLTDLTSAPELYDYYKQTKSLSNSKISKKEKIAKAKKLANQYKSFFKNGKFKVFDFKQNIFPKTEDAKVFATITLLATGGLGLASFGGLSATLSATAFWIFDAYQTAAEALRFLRKPTAKQFGELAFFALPYTLSILKEAKKLSPNFKASAKNVQVVEKTIINIEKKLKSTKTTAKKSLKGSTPKERANLKKRIKEIDRLLDDIKQARKEIDYVKRNPNIIKTRDYNPIVYSRELLKLIDSYQTGYHVSTQPKPSKLFGQYVPLSEKELLKLVKKDLAKVKEPKKIAKIKETKINKIIINNFKKYKAVLGGATAQNLQVSIFKRRKTTDFDGKVSKDARTILNEIKKQINREVGLELYEVRRLGNKDTYSLFNKETKSPLVELTNVGKEKMLTLGAVKNPQGILIESKLSLAKGKIGAISRPERFLRKGATDLLDFKRLTGKSLKQADMLRDNPSDVFQVVRQEGGMGKDRLRFDETHLYFDSEAAIGYSQGKKYSIIKFPLSKIQKFPKSLTNKINKAKKGLLKQSEIKKLRVALNNYIKSNIKKFYTSPRTSSLPIGEKEWVLAEGSKFFKNDIYKTWDNDLRSFVNIVEVAFTKKKAKSFYRKLKEAYKKQPFKEIKFRLTNPDLLKVRRYRRLIEKGFKLTNPQKSTLSKIVNKFFSSFKEMLKDKKGSLKISKDPLIDDVFLETQRRKKAPESLNVRRLITRPLKLNAITKVAKIKEREVTRKTKTRTPKRTTVKNRQINRVLREPARSLIRPTIRPIVRPKARKITREKVRERVRPITRIDRIVRPKARDFIRPVIRPIVRPRIRPKITKPKIPKPIIRPRPKFKEQLPKRIEAKDVVKNKFVYLADLYSRFYGIKATKRQRQKLLKVGRIFKGFERRAITK